jgi:hypothetical protein
MQQGETEDSLGTRPEAEPAQDGTVMAKYPQSETDPMKIVLAAETAPAVLIQRL